MHKQRAEVLEKHGFPLLPHELWDFAKSYILNTPTIHTEAVRRRRKFKHISQWRGPLEITRKLSGTTFERVLLF